MKQAIVYFLSFFILGTILSCHKSEKEIETDYMTHLVNEMSITDNIRWVVILPGLGCHGCIQEGEMFMKKNVQNKDIYFVLTKVESLKILQNKIGVRVKDYPNIYVDKDNKVNIPTDNSIYPCIIQVKNGALEKYEFQAPYNSNAFSNLKLSVRIQSE